LVVAHLVVRRHGAQSGSQTQQGTSSMTFKLLKTLNNALPGRVDAVSLQDR
jgi:hypothetical protein